MPEIERHPFEPFLPTDACVLFLGSFPPQRKRWCMEFYYPNWLNDFWRVCGLVFFGEKDYFVLPGQKRFDLELIKKFCIEKGIALFDTATEVRRLQDNASDKFLEVVTPTDLPALLARIPSCRAIVTTGQKATETIVSTYSNSSIPPVGGCTGIVLGGRPMDFYRMPSTSRAYPLSLEKKA
ncbi:MAG: uracil-DNA glycosylase family protein, partial [Bacteroidales bacterium]|nr:uracil-DNA glycosylase family protein [Bacteroidales bacterium]